MEGNDKFYGLDYNTSRERLKMPEYGRNVLKMVENLKKIEDRSKRTEQARAIVKVMETLSPGVHSQENFEMKLWDLLYIIADYDLDVDSPYPAPSKEEFETRPVSIPMKEEKIKAFHYGRNIERMIALVCELEDGDTKTRLIHALATYMRQQYLIWNKDSVSDETIFGDIEKLSAGRLKVPQGMELDRISSDASFSKPTMMLHGVQSQGRKFKKKGFKKK